MTLATPNIFLLTKYVGHEVDRVSFLSDATGIGYRRTPRPVPGLSQSCRTRTLENWSLQEAGISSPSQEISPSRTPRGILHPYAEPSHRCHVPSYRQRPWEPDAAGPTCRPLRPLLTLASRSLFCGSAISLSTNTPFSGRDAPSLPEQLPTLLVAEHHHRRANVP